jgi:hypothetical protein
VPFSGLEPAPKPQAIAKALHVETSVIQVNLTRREGLLGLSTEFLFQQASLFAEIASNTAFYSTLALLIYGLVLFPNIKDFININTIQIFLSRNHVPTLLAETYYSIHDRTTAKRGTILCCASLLYKWYITHLPRTRSFKENPDKLRWSQRIRPLTSVDIVWYNPAYYNGAIIDNCGEFPNVPLLGMHGGITYSPILARCQFGYLVKERPSNLSLNEIFYRNQEGNSDMRNRFV